jgi:hypothetical protein
MRINTKEHYGYLSDSATPVYKRIHHEIYDSENSLVERLIQHMKTEERHSGGTPFDILAPSPMGSGLANFEYLVGQYMAHTLGVVVMEIGFHFICMMLDCGKTVTGRVHVWYIIDKKKVVIKMATPMTISRTL